MWKRLIVVVVLAGCSHDDGSGACESAGSRLHPMYATTTDGFRQFFSWNDTQRNEACTFSQHLDGTWRCLPATNNTSGYADAACTQPVVALPSCGAAKYALESTSTDTCTQTANIRPLGTAYTGTLYSKSSGPCVSAGTAQAGTVTTGAAIAPDEFVSATLGTPSGSARLRQHPLVAADGAQDRCSASLAIYDSMRDEDCSIYSDGTPASCLPSGAGLDGKFADTGCTKPAAEWPACDTTPPKYVVTAMAQMTGTCTTGTTHPVYVAVPATGEYQGTPSTCTAFTEPSPDPYTHYAEDAVVAQTEFQEVMTMTGSGSSRLQAAGNSTADGFSVTTGVRDTMLGVTCAFEIAADGQLRCLPQVGVYNFWSDAACTVPIGVEFAPPACAGAAPGYLLVTDTTACPSKSRVFSLGPASSPTAIYFASLGSCMLLTANPTTMTYYPSTGEVPAAMFASVTDDVE